MALLSRHIKADRIVNVILDYSFCRAPMVVPRFCLGMMRIKAVFQPEQRVSQPSADVAGVAAHFLDAQGHLVLELNPMSEPIIHVDVGDFVSARYGISLANESHIDLPMSISRSIRIVRTKGRPTLCEGQR
jgi:hypothetical protein